MDWLDFTLKLCGALSIYSIGLFVLTKLIKPSRNTWVLLLIIFSSAFIYTTLFVNNDLSRTVVLMSAQWGAFGLSILSFESAKESWRS